MTSDPNLATHDADRELVKNVFVSMGGKIVDDAFAVNPPPKRPRHTPQGGPGRDAFMCDFENDVLRCWDARGGIPRGPRRFENEEWAALIMSHVFPHNSGWRGRMVPGRKGSIILR